MLEFLPYLLGALLGLTAIAGIRYADSASWRKSLTAYRLRLPRNLDPATVSAWLATIAASTRSSANALLPYPPIVIEVVATPRGIAHYVLVPRKYRLTFLAGLRAALPGARLEEAPEHLHDRPLFGTAAEIGLSSDVQLLAVERTAVTSAAVMASLQPLHSGGRPQADGWFGDEEQPDHTGQPHHGGQAGTRGQADRSGRAPGTGHADADAHGSHEETIYCQWIIGGVTATGPIRQPVPPLTPGFVRSAVERANAEQERAARIKHALPLLRGVGRIGVVASRPDRRGAMLTRVVAALRTLDSPGVSVRRLAVPSTTAGKRLTNIALPLFSWGVVVNAEEAVGLLGLPVGEVTLPGLGLGSSRQLPPAPGMPRGGTGGPSDAASPHTSTETGTRTTASPIVIAESNYPGMRQSLALLPDDRLRHSWIIGPTGVGKSTLLATMIVQDLDAGRGVVAVDPKGDLITDVLARVPKHRMDDLVVLDLAATDQPVGINLLRHTGSEHSRELAVDHVVHIMAALWHGSWGPRTSDVLRSALLTLTHTTAPDGSAFTLAEVPELLTNPALRRYVLAQPSVPASVRPFWTEYEQRTDADRLAIIGPSLNKLRALNSRTALRLALGQSQGFDLGEVFSRRRALLVSLAKGTLGTETAQLFGALLVAILWQKILGRVAVPAEQRRPVFVYLDEFQDVVRLPLDLGDMLAQARGLGVGLVLAHQHLGQLPDAVKTAVLGTARTQIAFQLAGYDDARVLSRPFAPLTPDDLLGLDAYEIAMRPCVGGRTLGVVTGKTSPLPEGTYDSAAVAAWSRQRYGTLRAEVEAALAARITVGNPGGSGGRMGRQRRGGTP